MNFGEAQAQMDLGRMVARTGWNGKGMFIYKTVGNTVTKDFVPNFKSLPDTVKTFLATRGTDVIIQSSYTMYTAACEMQPGWLASQSDMQATDWENVSVDGLIQKHIELGNMQKSEDTKHQFDGVHAQGKADKAAGESVTEGNDVNNGTRDAAGEEAKHEGGKNKHSEGPATGTKVVSEAKAPSKDKDAVIDAAKSTTATSSGTAVQKDTDKEKSADRDLKAGDKKADDKDKK